MQIKAIQNKRGNQKDTKILYQKNYINSQEKLNNSTQRHTAMYILEVIVFDLDTHYILRLPDETNLRRRRLLAKHLCQHYKLKVQFSIRNQKKLLS